MRDWCLVLDTVSPAAARELGKALAAEGIDVDIDASEARVWCFAATKKQVLALARQVVEMDEAGSSKPALQLSPKVRVWSEKHHRYVDPAAPDEDPDTHDVWIDSELTPGNIGWRVRLELASVFEFRRVRGQLPALRRPIIQTGNCTIDLGAKDFDDAHAIAAQASAIEGVVRVHPTEIKGHLSRWLIRQRLAGNYGVASEGPGSGYGYSSHVGWGDGGAGGDGGSGGGGGGGNGGG
jgi:uncharacterized membrane protein YgcG